MAATKLVNLLAILTLAILACSFSPTPANALSIDSTFLARNSHSHSSVAKRKRSTRQKRCKARTPPKASSTAASSTAASSTAASTPSAKPTATGNSSGNNSGGDSGGSSGGNGGKIGLAWANGADNSLSNFVNSKVNFIYTWGPSYPAEAKQLGLEPMPMLWGDRQISQFQELVKPGYANYILGMNEPNESGQSNMTPEHGAELWMEYIQPMKAHGYQLISPATSSNPNGLTWVTNFMKACTGCTFDGVAVHWYDVNAADFIKYINLWHDTFGKPIYVTEFACQNFNGGAQCTQDEVDSFMAQVTSYMDSVDWVKGYFAFGIMHDMQGVNNDNQLMAPNGLPTKLGYQYLGS